MGIILINNLKKLFVILLLIMVSSGYVRTYAQTVTPFKIAVFAPVYLDDAFNESVYTLGNNNIPKNILPGLDFYNGIQLAIDSLQAEGQQLEILFFDLKSKKESIDQLIQSGKLNGTALLIASFNNRSDIKPLADFAKSKQIPLISATYPNDAGIRSNPFFALVNPTLLTHIEGLFKYLQKNHPTEPILYIKKAGPLEDMIEQTFLELNKKTPALPLKLKTISVSDSINISQFNSMLDSSRTNFILCGTINEAFGINLVKSVAANKPYKSVVLGMPTWDAIKDLGKGTEIIYSTPFNYNRTDKLLQRISTQYRNKLQGRPSDMVFKGFESLYHFGRLLIKHQQKIATQLSDNSFKIFNEFDFVPVQQNGEINYLENKKLYFVSKSDGIIKAVQ